MFHQSQLKITEEPSAKVFKYKITKKKMKTYKSKADKQIHDDLRGELRRNMQELREISNRRDYTEPDELPEENKKVGILYGRIGEIYEEMA